MDRRSLFLGAASGFGLGLVAAVLPGRALATPKSSSGGNNPYVVIPPATGVVPRRDRRRSTLTVEMGLEIQDRDLRDRAYLSRPRLSAAYNEIVRTTASRLLPGIPPDIEAIGDSLQAATDRVLGRSGAKLLLGSVVVN